ncbi:CPBP family intramembrane glutamic endopeptidase [Pseudokineococcus sp. 1T1Z-3]|uniref:CPBP family intramembrane glutamic endopeptidase n=1 Tax=Pseudokineococcus sp. 1T1Z-3 TaxID=3132745 RepID=UPI0030A110F0
MSMSVRIALALLVPPQTRSLPVRALRRGRLLASTAALAALALAFPVVVAAAGLRGEDYVLAKTVGVILLPLLVVVTLRGAVATATPRAAWRWWAPVLVVAVWASARSWVSEMPDYSSVAAADLLVAATATAVTAGLGEELFYRRLLQTRLEALLGGGPGVVLTSLAFALMHLGSHGTGDLVADVARVVVAQGTFGLFVGVLWWRYRNFTLVVVAHVLANGYPEVVAEVLSR